LGFGHGLNHGQDARDPVSPNFLLFARKPRDKSEKDWEKKTLKNKPRVLVVDDEPSMRELLEIVLEGAGYVVRSVANPDAARALMQDQPFDAVLTDLYMGNDRQAGLTLLSWMVDHVPATPAIMMTAHGSVETAIEAMRRGAADYIQKPFKTNDEVRIRIERAIRQRNLVRENVVLRNEQAQRADFKEMVGTSPAFARVQEMIRRVATLPSTIAIHGESGAGKELVARELHQLSDRADKPFVAINCGGIPENLLESELFGYKKGAFTGATEDKEGLFAVADGGTLFLDEIAEMPQILQVKLLRVLDNSIVTPVGGTTPIKINVRVLSATNRDLAQMAEEGLFRKDLYYRLNVIPLHVPPLRERTEDIPLLCRHFLHRHAQSMGRPGLVFSPEALDALAQYPWPGNVRELSNLVERVAALTVGDRVELSDLPPAVRQFTPNVASALPQTLPEGGIQLESIIEDLETAYIRQALEHAKYSHKRAAELLGMTPRSLRYRLRKYHLDGD